jgi:hypothetical protein
MQTQCGVSFPLLSGAVDAGPLNFTVKDVRFALFRPVVRHSSAPLCVDGAAHP